jgi:hypothetical protein
VAWVLGLWPEISWPEQVQLGRRKSQSFLVSLLLLFEGRLRKKNKSDVYLADDH